MRPLTVLALLLGGLALGQDDLGVEIEMLEPDLDYLLETLEAVSCLCSCEDWCSGACAGAASCEDWCACEAELAYENEHEPEYQNEFVHEDEPEYQNEIVHEDEPEDEPEDEREDEREPEHPRSALVPFADTSVFSGFGAVTVPTCACVWQLADGTACSADASWPAEADGVCECGDRAPGCVGEATSISVLLAPPDKRPRRR